MTVYGIVIYLESPRVARRGRFPYILLNLLIFSAWSVGTLLHFHRYFTLWWQSTSPLDYHSRMTTQLLWAAHANDILKYFSVCVGDMLMLYRCYNMWADKLWVLALPVLINVAMIGTLFCTPIQR